MPSRLSSWVAGLFGARRPRIDLYTIGWNEERMLEFFFRHYDPLVTRYVFYDDGSTDRTLEILRGRPNVEVRRFERCVEDSFVYSAQRLHNEMWKESRGRADWVIYTAVDEHLHHPDLHRYLSRCRREGVTAVPGLGFQMVATAFPAPGLRLASSLTRGAPYHLMSKLSIWDPDAIEETGFGLGRHAAAPSGRVRYPDRDEVLNLHYKYLGLDYLNQRNTFLGTGLGERDREQRLGFHYFFTEAENRKNYEDFAARAVDVMQPGMDPSSLMDELPWWRATGGRQRS